MADQMCIDRVRGQEIIHTLSAVSVKQRPIYVDCFLSLPSMTPDIIVVFELGGGLCVMHVVHIGAALQAPESWISSC